MGPDSEVLHPHLLLLLQSYRRWTGRDLAPGIHPENLAKTLFEAPFVLVSHGPEADPVLNYGNGLALELWEMNWEELLRTPSRLTAETPDRAERARLLAEVTAHGYIDHYSGVRISKHGRRFRIEGATVWNLVDDADRYCGQAATFSKWVFL